MEERDMSKYKEVTLQIRKAIKEDLFDSRQSFDEEKQKEVAEILKNNFNMKDEEMGKVLIDNIPVGYRISIDKIKKGRI